MAPACRRRDAPGRGWDLTLCSRTPAVAGLCPAQQNHQQPLQGMSDPTNYREGQKRHFALTCDLNSIFFSCGPMKWPKFSGVFHNPARASCPAGPSLLTGCLQRGRGEGRCRGCFPSRDSTDSREPLCVEAQAGDWLGDSKSAQSQLKWLNRNWIQLVQPCGFRFKLQL